MTAIKPWRKHTTTSPQRSLALWANVSWLNGRSDTSSAVLRGRDSIGSTRVLIHCRAQILSLMQSQCTSKYLHTYSKHNRGRRMKMKITTPKTCVMPGTNLVHPYVLRTRLGLGRGFCTLFKVRQTNSRDTDLIRIRVLALVLAWRSLKPRPIL
jgi:hypothetical protein